jgi:hypothetical protein
MFVPNDGPPRPMEREGPALSIGARHLPDLARALMGATQRAAELGNYRPPQGTPSRCIAMSWADAFIDISA